MIKQIKLIDQKNVFCDINLQKNRIPDFIKIRNTKQRTKNIKIKNNQISLFFKKKNDLLFVNINKHFTFLCVNLFLNIHDCSLKKS